MSHYSKRSVRDMSLSERVHKLFFSERSLRPLQLSHYVFNRFLFISLVILTCLMGPSLFYNIFGGRAYRWGIKPHLWKSKRLMLIPIVLLKLFCIIDEIEI